MAMPVRVQDTVRVIAKARDTMTAGLVMADRLPVAIGAVDTATERLF